MGLRIPPLLPAQAVLIVALAYAAGSLWLGLARLDSITTIAESGTQSAATVQDLEGLLLAVGDIETAGRGYALTGDDAYLAPLERGRGRITPLLAGLRDRMRDDASELALVERLVPLIAERTAISTIGIERKRADPEKPYVMGFGTRGRDVSEEIRTTVMELVGRERDQLERDRVKLAATINDARRDMYLFSGVTLLLVVLLYLAVGRLRAFIRVEPAPRRADAVDLGPAAGARTEHDGVGALLRDALLRTRLTLAEASPDSPEHARLQTLAATLEQAGSEQTLAARGAEDGRRGEQDLVPQLEALAVRYTRPGGMTVKPTIDQSAEADADATFIIVRSVEWALEAVTLRKRAGDATLHLTANNGDAVVRVFALADTPDLPVVLSPREAEQADALQRAVHARGGAFAVADSPTGIVLTLRIPLARGFPLERP